MALPTATRARSLSSGNDRGRPLNPAALASWATSQSRSARRGAGSASLPGVSSSSSASRPRSRPRYSAIAAASSTG